MSQNIDGPNEPVGARAVQAPARKRGLPAWLLPLVMAVLAVLAVLLLLSRCGGGSSGTAATATTATPTPATATSAPDPSPTADAGSGAGGTSGTITANGKTMLPLAGGSSTSLAAYAGQDVKTTSVMVQSVPADEGFWVGSSASNRVWVQLTGRAGESPYQVKTGDLVTFTGAVTKNVSGFAAKAGVTPEEGRSQLTGQKYHIDAAKASLKLAA